VPYLQLDVPNHYPVEVKRGLARRLGEKYARIMQTTPDMVTVAFRELGEGGVWRCNAGEPEPAAVLSCDIRRGRLPEQRAELAEALIHACVETLGLRCRFHLQCTAIDLRDRTADRRHLDCRPGRLW
jgi:phenylpyruvate tautomerase PptA (4-oxalocrotonate tautomerase family)